jgi:hypothetical protein
MQDAEFDKLCRLYDPSSSNFINIKVLAGDTDQGMTLGRSQNAVDMYGQQIDVAKMSSLQKVAQRQACSQFVANSQDAGDTERRLKDLVHAQRRRVHHAMQVADVTGSGTLSYGQFGQALRMLQLPLGEQKLQQFCKRYDLAGKGSIAYEKDVLSKLAPPMLSSTLKIGDERTHNLSRKMEYADPRARNEVSCTCAAVLHTNRGILLVSFDRTTSRPCSRM